ncbi:uncharacterized protein LOC128186658 [Crassostrea angulata]|uniref:uncharacterized protein LOC128186658 n=1 Tax=Magallana angulata TaxID=2784310 RepID=UPI0022B13A60|nr:uncharacterized protein LOC128186658 [Crassostrea angulata]
MQPTKFHCSQKQGISRINVSNMSQPKLTQKFAETFEQELEFIQKGTSTEESTALEAFGKRTTKTTDWFEAKSSVMIPAIESKRIALEEYKRTPSQKNLLTLRAAREKSSGWLDSVQMNTGKNSSRPSRQPLYLNTVTVSALDAIECLPTMDELDVEPTLEELSKAIDNLTSGKAPGNDRIPPDLLKQCKSSLLSPLHKVLGECWEDGSVPQDMGCKDRHPLQKQGRKKRLVTVRLSLKEVIISTLLYGSESWTTYSRQERKLNTSHLRYLRRILGISWQDKVPYTEVLSRANLPSMFTLLRQRRLRWLGHVRRMDDGRIPKDILYGELRSGKRSTGRPQLRFKDVVKRDMKALDIDVRSWEDLAADRPRWTSTLLRQIKSGEESLCTQEKTNAHNESSA